MESCSGAVWYCNIGLQAGFKRNKISAYHADAQTFKTIIKVHNRYLPLCNRIQCNLFILHGRGNHTFIYFMTQKV